MVQKNLCTQNQSFILRLKGLFSENSEFLNVTELRESFQYHHFKNPALFDLIFAFLKDVFNMQDLQEIYFFRHLLIYTIFQGFVRPQTLPARRTRADVESITF